MRIEGPTHTIYEETIVVSPKTEITNNGHTASCDGPKGSTGASILAALQETGQFFQTNWTGSAFGGITKINETESKNNNTWVMSLTAPESGSGPLATVSAIDYCQTVLPNHQHVLYAYIREPGAKHVLIMSGPSTAKVGVPATYTVPYAIDGSWVSDVSVDSIAYETVHKTFYGTNVGGPDVSVDITFPKAGTYNMKAHCAVGSYCVRSNHVVTVVTD